MRLNRIIGLTLASLCLAPLPGCEMNHSPQPGSTPQINAVRGADEQDEGARSYARITRQFGIYDDPELTAYVDRIGRRLAKVSEQPDAPWTFTVLDTAAVNAYSTQGGYIYLTRGLLALASDEAQLAGVIGHEIGHVTAGHYAQRLERSGIMLFLLSVGAIGLAVLGADPTMFNNALTLGEPVGSSLLAVYSRSDEIEADDLGIRYMLRAGYDPYAQADFLKRLTASRDLQLRIAQTNYDASRVDFFATHPSNAPRIRQAIQTAHQAAASAPDADARNRKQFLAAIDGIVYGVKSDLGFVEGRTFRHPRLGISLTAPPQFTFTSLAQAIVARGPQGARFIMAAAEDHEGPLTDYIRQTWMPAIASSASIGALRDLTSEHINGIEAATAVLPVEDDEGAHDVLLVAYRLDRKIYRVIGTVPEGADLLPALREAARTFRRLSAEEAARLREKRIEIVSAESEVDAMAARMNVTEYRVELFRVLNGLAPEDALTPGTQVKVVR
jgi:predicted Zn-dependent protease